MPAEDFIIFDTSTLPDYYDDVHKILALPRGHVVTYDYSASHIDDNALTILRNMDGKKEQRRVLLAYLQAQDYQKGDPSADDALLPQNSFATLTRLAKLVAVRSLTNNNKTRYYLDLELLGYPFDRNQTIAKDIVAELRKQDSVPMKKYISVCPDNAIDALFNQTGTDDQGFSTVVDGLSTTPSQFYKDTFWRITRVTYRTKALLPFVTPDTVLLSPLQRLEGQRTQSYLRVDDQSTIWFHLQFHRGREHGPDYRIRKIGVQISPQSTSELALATLTSRSFGQATIAVKVPATSSLSLQDFNYEIDTLHHEKDERKDYPYGPNLRIAIQYRKSALRSVLSLLLICAASALFGWAAFTTSVLTATPVVGKSASMCARIAAVIGGVLCSLYSYYLWSDEISPDRARRN